MIKLRVREIAERRGVNRSQLSRRADLALTTINDIWDGRREDVRLSTLSAIARVLGVKVVDLIEEVNEAPLNGAVGHREAPGKVHKAGNLDPHLLRGFSVEAILGDWYVLLTHQPA